MCRARPDGLGTSFNLILQNFHYARSPWAYSAVRYSLLADFNTVDIEREDLELKLTKSGIVLLAKIAPSGTLGNSYPQG